MAIGQFLVRLLNGRTRCVRFTDPAVSCKDLKSRLFELEGIPSELQRIVTGTREVQDGEVIDECVGTLSVLLRLRGGKGGFGSLLRASKARQKKTNNFDACRDMSGRRLRHVNAEKKVKEWQEEAPLRELEATAMEYLTKKSKKMDTETASVEELKKFREQTEQKAAEVQEAVLDGLRRSSKRKMNRADSKKANKKAKTIADDSDEDVFSAEASSSKQKVETTAVVREDTIAKDIQPMAAGPEETSMEIEQAKAKEETQPAVPFQAAGKDQQVLPEEAQADASVKVQSATLEEPVAELKFEDIHSVKDLEALGLERLKTELQQRGLKCGGSLAERAARLFLLKSTPLEKLETKHLAVKPKLRK